MVCPFLLSKEAPYHWARGEEPRFGRGGEEKESEGECVCVYLKKTLGYSCLKPQGHKLTIPKTKECLFCQAACLKGPGWGRGSLPAVGLSACLPAQLSFIPLVISHLSSTFSVTRGSNLSDDQSFQAGT